MEAFFYRNIPFDNLEGGLGYFCPKTCFLRCFHFVCYHFPRPPQLLQIVSIILYLIYHHQHPYFFFHHLPQFISKSFSHMTPWLRGPPGSFDSLTFCVFLGAFVASGGRCPQAHSFIYFLSVAATYFQFHFLNYA